ncbi:MAG: Asp-tRNA(Asn)/Glu-tRNA(Gln) amidotransferase subunit GatA [Phycisphaerales bacterium]|nr:Asp-tRNA(Asn)/Glu-tRNA(Gln) amidotransferase subunit GatA [Planctomycetota bacterium]
MNTSDIHSGKARDRALASLRRAEELDSRIHAFTQLFSEKAIARAEEIDAGGAGGALAGVPVALKDNLCLSWGRTTCGSNMLRDYESPYTATAAQRLIDAGAVIIGKTNLDEYAMGSSTEHSCFGPTSNPWDLSRVPGGSSGGSAAAVAAGIVPIALGSDTGGSVRQPASLCGIVGVKPTYGRVSRYGLVAYASSLDQIGTLTRNIGDAASALGVICGHDPLDSTSSLREVPDFSRDLDAPVQGLRLAVPAQARNPANHPEVSRVFAETIEKYKQLGATIVDVDLPLIDHGIAAYYIVAPAEASSNLARLDGIRYGRRARLAPGEDLFELYCKSRSEGFGPEVQRRIMLGTHVLSSGYYDAYYNTALKVRRRIKDDFDRVFSDCHAVLMPASPSPAWKIGEKANDPLAMYLEDVYTVTINLAGLPAMSVPAGLASVAGAQLPVGVQIVSQAFDEARMLRIGRMFELATDWHTRRPPL